MCRTSQNCSVQRHEAREGHLLRTLAPFLPTLALIKNEARFAGVRADAQLKCMTIDRTGFEKALGGSLKDLLAEQEYT